MELLVDPEVLSLQSSIREFLDKEYARLLRPIADAALKGEAAPEGVWDKVAGLGWAGLVVAEEYGGSGMGWTQAVALAQEAGRALFSGPLHTATAVAAAISSYGSEDQKKTYLPGLADGSVRVGICGWDPSRFWVDADREHSLSGGSFALEGEGAGLLLVPCRRGGADAVALVDVPADEVTISPVMTVDPTRPQAKVKCQRVPLSASQMLDGPALHMLRDLMILWLAAEQAGITQRVMELSIGYAKSRMQFGKPIGSYQAVSHKIADMYMGAEHAQSLIYHAAWAADSGTQASLAAWEAKVWADQAASSSTADAIQVHGGIGFTWEHDLHLFYKRARSNRSLVGSPRQLKQLISEKVHVTSA